MRTFFLAASLFVLGPMTSTGPAFAFDYVDIMPVIIESTNSEFANKSSSRRHHRRYADDETESQENPAPNASTGSASSQANRHPHYTDEEIIQGYDTAVRTMIYHAYDLSDVQVPEGMERAWIHVEMQLHMDMFARYITRADLSDSLRGTVDQQVKEMFHANLPFDIAQRDIDRIHAEALVQVRETVDTLWAKLQ